MEHAEGFMARGLAAAVAVAVAVAAVAGNR